MAEDSTTGGAADTMGTAFKSAGDALKDAGSKAAENSSAMSMVAIEHAEQNTREAFAAMRAMAGATSVSDVLKIQSDYVREQSSRSLSQARQIGELIADFGRSAVQPLTGRKP